MKILYAGPEQFGSNADSLAKAFRKLDIEVTVIDEGYYHPKSSNKYIRQIYKPFSSFFYSQFNNDILSNATLVEPDLFFAFKGTGVFPSTLEKLKQLGIPTVLFFPDVSFFAHDKNIHQSVKLYSHIFTTKKFGITDLKEKFNYTNTTYLPPGFDPDVHRPVKLEKDVKDNFSCDISFIGTWSPKKENILAFLVKNKPDLDLKIWGNQWEKNQTKELLPFIQYKSTFGDSYSRAINRSKINLGLLSEIRTGASDGDSITTRTFEIPASGGFMIHERTSDFLELFQEDVHSSCFEDNQELLDKIVYYLNPNHEEKRLKVMEDGLHYTVENHSWQKRAQQILEKLSVVLDLKI